MRDRRVGLAIVERQHDARQQHGVCDRGRRPEPSRAARDCDPGRHLRCPLLARDRCDRLRHPDRVTTRHVIRIAAWVGVAVGAPAVASTEGVIPMIAAGTAVAVGVLWLVLWLPRSAHRAFEAGRFARASRRYWLLGALTWSARREAGVRRCPGSAAGSRPARSPTPTGSPARWSPRRSTRPTRGLAQQPRLRRAQDRWRSTRGARADRRGHRASRRRPRAPAPPRARAARGRSPSTTRSACSTGCARAASCRRDSRRLAVTSSPWRGIRKGREPTRMTTAHAPGFTHRTGRR